MTTLFFLGLLTTLVVLPAYLFYWNLFRPVLIERLKYRLFKARDELRLLLVSGQIGEKEKAFPLVEMFCNKAVSCVDTINLSILIVRNLDRRSYLESKRDLEIIFNAAAPVRQLFIEAMSSIFGAAIANSPAVILLVAPVAVLSVTAFWFGRIKVWFSDLLARALGNICFARS